MKMKFKLLVFIGIAVFSMTMSSCKSKPKLMSPEEVTKMVSDKVEQQKVALGPELDKLCEKQTPQLVEEAVKQLVAASEAAPAQ